MLSIVYMFGTDVAVTSRLVGVYLHTDGNHLCENTDVVS